jgi:membrane-bound lytic murein transglycosylase B
MRPAEKTHNLLLFMVFLFLTAFAATAGAAPRSSQPSYEQWLDQLKLELSSEGVSDLMMEQVVFALSHQDNEVTDYSSEKFSGLVAARLTPDNIAIGRRVMQSHNEALSEIRDRYGVQPRFVVAVWGLLTNFGKEEADTSLLADIGKMAYKNNQSPRLKRELISTIKLLDQGFLTVDKLVGTPFGTLGETPFTASQYRRYAVDFNRDGLTDLWSSREDIFASTANFLKQMGWNEGQFWGREVRLPPEFDRNLIGTDQQRLLAKWQQVGVRQADGSDLPDVDIHASLIQPSRAGGRTFMVYDNYFTLLRWNRSQEFAFAAGMVSDWLIMRNFSEDVLYPYASMGN